MTHEEVHEAARRQPFEPFRLILTTAQLMTSGTQT